MTRKFDDLQLDISTKLLEILERNDAGLALKSVPLESSRERSPEKVARRQQGGLNQILRFCKL